MKYSTIFVIFALSLGLAACGGGGGGTSTTPATNNDAGTSTDGAPAPENPSYEGDKTVAGTPILTTASTMQRAGYFPATENKKDLPAGGPKSSDDYETLSIYSTINGPTPDDNITLAVNGNTYFANDGNAYAVYDIDDKGLSGLPVSATVGDHRWTRVEYFYVYSSKIEESQGYTSVNNGTITARDGDWKAEFGKVTLEGTIDGTVVSGKATGKFKGETIVGTFAGTDADYGTDKTPITMGGFAGNNKDTSFSGGWIRDYYRWSEEEAN